MSRVILIRHARAAWPLPGSRDFDRALDESGVADADTLGRKMLERGLVPDRVICSTARRARETWAHMAPGLEMAEENATFTDHLYTADTAGYAETIRQNIGNGTILIIGHNPMLEDVAMAFAGTQEARAALARGFAACGLAVIEIDAGAGDEAPLHGQLETYLTPADL